MRSIIAWSIRQTPAMNTMMVAILAVGILSGFMLRREEFPQFDLEIILVAVPYPGASPEEVESGICQKIEEAIRSVEGIKKITSVALEGAGNVVVEVRADVPSVQKVLSEIQSEIDRIPSFPDLAEEPEVQQVTFRSPAITVGIVALEESSRDQLDLELREITETVRDNLLLINGISAAEIVGERDYQIDVEIPEKTLRQYGLTLTEVAQRLRQRNLELPGGSIRSEGNTFLLRGKAKRLRGDEIAKIPILTSPEGVVLTIDDLGTVEDQFVDTTSISRINGKPGLAITVNAGKRDDLLAMADSVREYVNATTPPPGYEFVIWGDSSVNVRDRLDLLRRNGLQGLVLVFIVLALFLEFRLAFWVSMGIPVSLLGACAVLLYLDQTLNMLSLFAFLIALGIVVDDAIVIGENIYAHRELGKPFVTAAIEGTLEVVPSVGMSIATTVVAFMPMLFVTGTMGKFFAVMPLAVIAMLIISLLESTFILPCHLAHGRKEPFALTAGLNRFTSSMLNRFVAAVYTPLVSFSVVNPAVTCCTAIAILIATATLVTNGTVERIFFPKVDAPEILADVTFPDGTPSAVTDEATRQIEEAIVAIGNENSSADGALIRSIHRVVGTGSNEGGGGGFGGGGGEGSHVGHVHVELADNTQRTKTSAEILEMWRSAVGEIAGVEALRFKSQSHGPGGKAVEFKLLAAPERMAELEAVVEATKRKLATYEGVKDVDDDSRPGKWELQLKSRANGVAMGIPLEHVARTVRASYYGEEVMRLQRGRHEVKLMVRYPEEDRKSLAALDQIRIDAGDGVQRPITELAEVDVIRGYSEINRINQRRSITVNADVEEGKANAENIIQELKTTFLDKQLADNPWLSVRWEGQQEQRSESIGSLAIGMGIALVVMYVLLTIQFTSYLQPAIVMGVIPFGFVGAIWGHAIMDIPLTLFSMLGLVALTGVVVNDSIVLVDFINSRIRAGIPMREAILDSGTRRFRPVLLTSMTTIAGLLPILTERSFQAQMVIPMAVSLCFGLSLATLLVLVLVPTFYSIYGSIVGDHMGRDLGLEPERNTSDLIEQPDAQSPNFQPTG
ncbi:MAG: efflux RND transporter permease subunit [Planctomycetaceae bacterium]